MRKQQQQNKLFIHTNFLFSKQQRKPKLLRTTIIIIIINYTQCKVAKVNENIKIFVVMPA